MLLKSTNTSAIGPDTNAPTVTERTGFTVPVELTTVSTRPRETLAVVNFLSERPFHHDRGDAANPAGTPTTSPMIKIHRTQRRITLPSLNILFDSRTVSLSQFGSVEKGNGRHSAKNRFDRAIRCGKLD